ncbi:MAG: STAS domain-containing protein [Oscillospiraceae bacterium]|nr:STAS domain-containing protein [Oscillospiraceae bacterium]
MNELTFTVDRAHLSARRYILCGRISSAESNILQYELEEAMRDGYVCFVLNMRKITFLSSAGIRVLLMFYKKSKERGGSFHVENPSENVINVLGMTALDEMLLK